MHLPTVGTGLEGKDEKEEARRGKGLEGVVKGKGGSGSSGPCRQATNSLGFSRTFHESFGFSVKENMAKRSL